MGHGEGATRVRPCVSTVGGAFVSLIRGDDTDPVIFHSVGRRSFENMAKARAGSLVLKETKGCNSPLSKIHTVSLCINQHIYQPVLTVQS